MFCYYWPYTIIFILYFFYLCSYYDDLDQRMAMTQILGMRHSLNTINALHVTWCFVPYQLTFLINLLSAGMLWPILSIQHCSAYVLCHHYLPLYVQIVWQRLLLQTLYTHILDYTYTDFSFITDNKTPTV